MNTPAPLILACAGLAAALCQPSAAWAQGSLTPPGAPAPTMKSLAQVEPRSPVGSAPVTLSQPGSYYLTTNLSGTVTITADNVALDLMGFSIAVSAGHAITVSGARRNIWIHGGALASSSESGLVFSSSASNANSLVEGLLVGPCSGSGIAVNSGVTVRDCRVFGGSFAGISVFGGSAIRDCLIEGCGTGLLLTGTGAQVADNVVRRNNDNYNISSPNNRLELLVSELPESVNWPCTLKLASSLSLSGPADGISVYANNVTIDLCGHSLIGPGSSSGNGIVQGSTFKNFKILNGSVTGWCGEDKAGIVSQGDGTIISGVQAYTNSVGIACGSGAVIDQCIATGNGGSGLDLGGYSVVSKCTAIYNGGYGIVANAGSSLSECAAAYNALNGIELVCGNLDSCSAVHNRGAGIKIDYGGAVSLCTANFNAGDGFSIGNNCSIMGCNSYGNGNDGDGAGFHLTSARNRLEGCHAQSNDRGYDVDGTFNFIFRNTASGNTTNWTVAAGNVCLVVSATATGGPISGNSGGTAPGSTDPNANFTY